MNHTKQFATAAASLGLCLTAAGQTNTPAAKPAAKPTPATAGLLNDWLRAQSSEFKKWDIGGQVRFRYEAFDNGPSVQFPSRDFQRTGTDNDNAYFLAREKFHIGYAPFSWLSVYAEGRDSSSTGDDHAANPGADEFDLHQAYLTLGDAKKFPITLKAGRQEMIYGDERVIGASDWSNVPRVFDVAKLRFENDHVWIDAFSGRLVITDNHNFNVVDDYDWFSGVYASSKTALPFQETQLYFLSRNSTPSARVTARDVYSIGTRMKSLPGKFGGWDYSTEVVKQYGSINLAGQRRDHDALAANFGGGYTWAKSFGSPRLGLEYNFSSGDGNSGDGKSGTLDNLFPTNHKFYGNMDFLGWRNVHNPRAQFTIKPTKALSVMLDYQLYWLASTSDSFYPQSGGGRTGNGYGINPGFSSFVGSEVNLDATYTVNSWFAFRAGYGHFFVGDYVKQSKAAVGGAVGADWVYLQTTLTF